ncbi:hypothetical protein LSUB1_G003692 [Lachnellula subtilissima]|uniref:Uncharacterized protein n=1 Tax=Lachnellula subtilissima TaxID=602034 RepID=A0A8H8RP08_9HELO|nr:hypothetical protein LSUB1_G003692 [Lachnellula subtilissima]
MNRYPRPPTGGGASRATAATLCQKCLKKDRPYVPRPSRTQQLLNPKLVPKLTSDVPNDLSKKFVVIFSCHPQALSRAPEYTSYTFCLSLAAGTSSRVETAGKTLFYNHRALKEKGVADEQLAKAEAERERGRKRERESKEPESAGKPKRMRSASASSVSTISTNVSKSPSPQQARPTSLSRSPSRTGLGRQDRRYSSISRSPPSRPKTTHEKKRRRDSYSSVDSRMSNTGDRVPHSRERGSSRSTRRRYRHDSPPARGRNAEIRSPQRRRRFSDDREPGRDSRNSGLNQNNFNDENKRPPREKSLSPFSKRLALTQSMNMGR